MSENDAYSSAFERSFARVFEHEAGYQADPMDRGNWSTGKIGERHLGGTKYGISTLSYPHLDIKNLSFESAKAIYWSDWWCRMNAGQFDAALGYQLFDAAVNHGMWATTKMLQRAVGVVADGFIGPITRKAIWDLPVSDVLKLFLAERLVYMTHCSGWGQFSKGWSRRIAKNLVLAAEDD